MRILVACPEDTWINFFHPDIKETGFNVGILQSHQLVAVLDPNLDREEPSTSTA